MQQYGETAPLIRSRPWRFINIITYLCTETERLSYRYETFRIDGQQYCSWDYAVKFARWQHPAMGRGAILLCLVIAIV